MLKTRTVIAAALLMMGAASLLTAKDTPAWVPQDAGYMVLLAGQLLWATTGSLLALLLGWAYARQQGAPLATPWILGALGGGLGHAGYAVAGESQVRGSRGDGHCQR